MTPEEMAQRAKELFGQRMHCSQAVAAAVQEAEGTQDPEVIKALGALGGGIASQGEACGCLTGGIAALSQIHSRSSPDQKESPQMWRVSIQLVKRFRELTADHGSINCRDIARVDWRDKEQVKEFYRNPDSRRLAVCAELVGDTARAAGEILAASREPSQQ
jgi:C_GCAxxG_C_C family probable redox protein